MEGQAVEEEKLAELADVYGMLKRDAKDMLFDLLDGVSLWKSTARILFVFAITAFALGLVFSWGASTTRYSGVYIGDVFIPIGLFLGALAVFLFGVFAVTTLTGMKYRRKYIRLKEKYSELYEAAKKLS